MHLSFTEQYSGFQLTITRYMWRFREISDVGVQLIAQPFAFCLNGGLLFDKLSDLYCKHFVRIPQQQFAGYPDFLEDCALSTAWAAKEASRYGGDPRRLYLMGHSSGAYNAAMLALDSRWLSAVGAAPVGLAGWIGLAGPYDFFPTQDPKTQPVFHHPNYPAGALPIAHVSHAAPRTFLGATAKDKLVDPVRNPRQLADKLSAAGVPVTLRIYGRVSHYTLIGVFARPLRGIDPVLDDDVTFVRSTSPRLLRSATVWKLAAGDRL